MPTTCSSRCRTAVAAPTPTRYRAIIAAGPSGTTRTCTRWWRRRCSAVSPAHRRRRRPRRPARARGRHRASVMVLSDPPVGTSSSVVDVSMMEQMRGREGDVVLVNGVVAPAIDARAGTLEHWRIVNASTSRYYRLALEDHELAMVGTDGGRLASPTRCPSSCSRRGNAWRCSSPRPAAGRYRLAGAALRPGPRGHGHGRKRGIHGPGPRRHDDGRRGRTGRGAARRARACVDPGAPGCDLAPGARRSRWAWAAAGWAAGWVAVGGGGGGRSFTIDGKTFDPARTDITTRLGRVEDWTITNSSTMDHPFHLHVWPFQVVAAATRSRSRRAGRTR